MFIACRLSTNTDAIAGSFRRAAAIFAAGFAILAVVPGTAYGEDGEDITISWEHASYSVHEGDLLGLAVLFSKVVPQWMIDDQVTPPEWYLTVRLTRTDKGGARQQVDYYGPGGSFKMYAGRRYAGFGFEAFADDVVDPGESVEIGFNTTNLPDGVVVGEPATTVVHILDGPSGPAATLELSPSTISENGGVSTVTARLNRAASEDITLNVAAAPAAGAETSDFTLSGNTTLTIAKGQTSSTGTVTVTARNNTVDAPDKTVDVTASVTAGPSNLRGPSGQMLTITDDEDTPTVALGLSPASISENAGVSTVTASLSHATSENVTLDVDASAGTGTAASDSTLSGNTTLTITAGRTSSTGTVTVTAENNAVHNADRTVEVGASVTAGPSDMADPAGRTLTITDDEGTPTVTLKLDPTSISEDEGVSTVTASLNHATGEDVTLSVAAAPLSGAVTGDYTLSGNTTLTIAQGQTSSTGTVTVTAEDNDDHSGAKTVRVTASVTAGPAGLTAPGAQTLTITDDEGPPTVTLELSSSTIPETNGESTVTASLNRATSEDVTLTVSSSPVSPAEAGDFTQTGTTLTITAGSQTSTGTVTIAAENDAVDTPDKEIRVSGAVTAGPTGMSAPAAPTLTITDDEATPTVTLVLTPDEISENGGRSTVTARLTGESSEAVTVTVSSSAVSPATSSDFTQSGTTLTIAAGSTSSTGRVTIAAQNNDVDTPNKHVTVSGSVSGGNGVSAPADQTLTITDDEATPTVTLVLTSNEISENAGSSTVTATLSGTSSQAVTVTVSTSAVSPATSTDFTQTGAVLEIAAGATTSTGTVTIAAHDNDVDAPDKTVTVNGSVSGGNDVSDPAAVTLTITDDEATPTVTLVLSADEIPENGGSSQVTATLDRTSSEAVTVTVSASAVSPAVAGDFTQTGTVLTIAAGATMSTGTVTIAARNNDVDAPDKTVRVSGSVSGGNGVSAPSAQTLTITDDEDVPTLSLKLSPSTIGENGGESTVTAELSSASSEDVTVTVSTTPATSSDFTRTGTTLTIRAGSRTSTGTVRITAVNNDVDAPSKSVTVRGTASGGNGVSAPADQTLTITDDEDLPTVTLVLTPSEISEDGDSTTVTATLNRQSSEAVTVTVSTSAVSPATSSDFTRTGTTLTIATGSTSSTGTVTIAAVNNAMDAPNKQVTVSATVSGGNGVSPPVNQTLRIIDDEGAPTVTLVLTPSEISENGDSSTVTATLSGTSSQEVTVTVSTSAVSPATTADFTQTGTQLTIAAGSTTSTGTVTIAAVNNDVDAPNKTVTVSGTVSGGDGVSAPLDRTLTIIDDEGAPMVTLVLTPDQISENDGSSTVTATLSGESSEDVTVTVMASAVSPAVSGDFTQTGTTLTITAGSTTSTGTVTIAAEDNDVDAPNKTVRVSGSASGGNNVSAPAAQTLTITDDEGVPTLSLELTPPTIGENGGESTVTARLTGASSRDVTVTVSTVPATSADFTQSGTVLTIAAGSTTSTGAVRIAAVNNDMDAPDKTVTVRGSASGGNGVSAPVDQTLTITDDEDTPTVTLVLSPDEIPESGGSTTVTATLNRKSSEAVTVSVSTVPATSADFTQSGTVLTIAAGSTTSTGTVRIAAVNNDVDAPNKTVTVSGSASGGNGVSSPADQTLTITDDEGAPTVTLVLAPDEISEDDGVSTVTATLTGASSENVTVTVATAAVLPATSGDFTQNGTTLTIAAGDTTSTGTVTIAAVDNDMDGPNKQVTVTGTVAGPAGVSAPAAKTLTITDDEGAPATKFKFSTMVMEEKDGQSEVSVSMNRATSEPVTVKVDVKPESSADMDDFTLHGDPMLTIPAGQMESDGSLMVKAVDDSTDNPNKQLMVTGSVMEGPQGVTPPAPMMLTITDDDDAPASTKVTLSAAPSRVSESAERVVTVTGTLDGAVLGTATTVSVSVSGGTATAGEDFVAVSDFPLTIEANEPSGSATFTLTPVDDAAEEGAETLVVSGTTSGLTVESATMTITDDDDDDTAVSTKVTLSAVPTEVSEGAGATVVTVTGTLDGAVLGKATMVTVSVAGGTATAGEDFAAVSDFPLTIGANEPGGSATFTLTPVDDAVEEDAETLVASGTTSDLTVESTTVTITDDDAHVPEPPAFTNARYAFTLQEQRDGRETPVALGVVLANDPDDQPLTYVLAAGDATRFAVGASSGAVTYVGPGEDYEAGAPPYELTVTVRDPDRQTASVAVEVTVTDRPEAPVASDDAAETREDEPKVIDVLANDRDPDGDRLRVSSVTAPEHGTATVVSGGVRYTPALNYHGRDEFRYTVSDPGGLTATATVKMTVTPVNDPPEAVDDEAETLEDEPVLVDVLANDTDVDGDRLRVVAATPPTHGTTTVEAGGVRYSPALDYHGPDRFVYTVSDPGGLTDTATVTLTVWPVNDAPEAVGVIPDQSLEEGGEAVTLDVAPYFTDVDGDVLTYTAESSSPAATLVTVAGSTLTLSSVVRGAATVTVTAADPEGLTATQVFGVTVGDRLVREVLTDTLAALGRGHLSSVRQTLGRRLETGGGESRRLTVAGQSFGPQSWDRPVVGGLAQTHELLFRAATLQQGDATDMVGTSADPRLRQPGSFGGGFSSFGPDWDQALPSTDVLMAFGGDSGAAEDSTLGRPRWTVWGQGDLQTFRGAPTDVEGYRGDLRTGYLGIDAQLSPHWLLGVAMARSGGASTWERGGSAGELSTTLTRVHPYVRWGNEDTAVWGVLGAGRGTATHVRTLTGLRETSPLGLGLGLLEGRRRLATVGGGVEIGVRGEASWARLGTGEGEETIDDLAAGVRRTRAGVEVARALSGPGGVTFTPFGAVSTRHDGGAGQTGVGLDVAAGLRVRGGRLQVEAQGRRLVLHSATAYEEQGVSLAASVGAGPYEPGLTLSLRPTWGAAGTGAETLWQDQIHTYMPGYDQSGIDAQLGYGMRLPGGRLLTPFGSYGQRQNSGRRLQVGAMVGSLGQMPGALDAPIQLEISGERYDRAGGRADHRFSMFGVLNLGGSSPSSANTLGIEPGIDLPASDLADVAALEDTEPLAPEPEHDAAPFAREVAPTSVNAAASSQLSPVEASTSEPAPTDAAPPAPTAAQLAAPMTVGAAAAVDPRRSPAEVGEAQPTTENAIEAVPSPMMVTARRETVVDIPDLPRSTAMATAPTSQAPAAPASGSTEAGVAQAEAARPAVAAPASRYVTARRALPPVPEPGWRSGPRSNRPPAFSAPTYAFEVPVRREGSGTEMPLGVVLARDPDRDPVTYSLTAGDWTRFRIAPSSGALVYMGPDLPGTRRYELQVTARDTGRLTETATVVVAVAAATEAPAVAAETAPTAVRPVARADAAVARASLARAPSPARRGALARLACAPVADTARTYRDVPVLIDVLANDGDIDGQRIVAVAEAVHGTATVTGGMVRYAPAPGHRGRDTFTYTVVGDDGRTARATVTVMVVG